MHVISKKTIKEFIRKDNKCEQQLLSWYQEACKAEWSTHQDVKDKYGNASILHNNIVVFNIKGNSYRLVVKIAFKKKTIFIKWIGTHTEYDKMEF